MYLRHRLPARFVLIQVALATLLSACGGYGGNYSAMGAGPGATCGGTYSVACPPPTVSLTAPAANATVSGTVTLTADATASSTYNLTVTSVAFLVDGTSVGTAMSSPYSFTWDSTKVANGNHTLTAMATDSASGTMTSAAVTVSVQNAGAAAAALTPAQIFATPDSSASGTAHFSAPGEGGVLSGTVSLSGMDASAVTLRQGLAGATGEVVLALTRSADHAGEWVVPANATLSEAQLAMLARGGLYLVAASATHPQGEIRGQLLPDGVRVSFAALGASPEARALGLQASGVVAATLDTRTTTLTVHVNSAGVDDATGAQLTGSAGTPLAELQRDALDLGHFSAELPHAGAAAVADFEAGRLSVAIAAASVPEGALRGAIAPN